MYKTREFRKWLEAALSWWSPSTLVESQVWSLDNKVHTYTVLSHLQLSAAYSDIQDIRKKYCCRTAQVNGPETISHPLESKYRPNVSPNTFSKHKTSYSGSKMAALKLSFTFRKYSLREARMALWQAKQCPA